MSSITPARPLWRRLRSRFAVLVSALALALSGMLATAGVAHADDHIEIDGPAATVPVNTPYTYTVTVLYEQTPSNETTLYLVPIRLSGAAATFTAVTDDAAGLDCSVDDPPHHRALLLHAQRGHLPPPHHRDGAADRGRGRHRRDHLVQRIGRLPLRYGQRHDHHRRGWSCLHHHRHGGQRHVERHQR